MTAIGPQCPYSVRHAGQQYASYRLLAKHIGWEVASGRHGANLTDLWRRAVDDAIPGLRPTFLDMLSEHFTTQLFGELRNHHYYDECQWASVATARVLGMFLGERIATPRLLSGQPVKTIGYGERTLTGEMCSACGINPLFSSPGGGVKCLDTTYCGYWTCSGSGNPGRQYDEATAV